MTPLPLLLRPRWPHSWPRLVFVQGMWPCDVNEAGQTRVDDDDDDEAVVAVVVVVVVVDAVVEMWKRVLWRICRGCPGSS